MTAKLQEIRTNLTAALAALPPARRALVLGAVAGLIGLVLVATWWVARPSYRPLFTNLERADASAIVAALEAEGVPHALEDGGRAVLVPADRLYDLRLALASRGLPAEPHAGRADLVQGPTDRRALEDELSRTVARLGGVESARVHLAIPAGSPDRKPSASVVVKLASGHGLTRPQLDAVVHLVAASAEGLEPESVTVVDEGGRLLTSDRREQELAGGGESIEYQRAVERATEERIESLLATVVGPGRVIARVAAAIDFARTERTEETYDPDRTVVRESRSTREETADPRAGDLANGAKPRATDDAGRPRTERRDETQSYDVSKTTSRTVEPVGAVKSLSVAVLVDGTYRDQNGTRVFVPRSDEELERIKTLAVSAAGISDARGDRLEVTSVPFQTPEALPAASVLARGGEWVPAMVGRLLAVGLVIALLVLVVRPIVQVLGSGAGGPRAGAPAGGEGPMGALARENVALARENPERAAQLVRQWLVESRRPAA